jgi:nitrogen fixation protein NifB
MAPDVWNKVKDHPCYSQDAHHYFARMHVAVAPACNIQCHYCNRKYDCANESRPGVVSETLTPELAARKVVWVASQVPQLSVVGIAGPGDALADPRKTFETCEPSRLRRGNQGTRYRSRHHHHQRRRSGRRRKDLRLGGL